MEKEGHIQWERTDWIIRNKLWRLETTLILEK